MNAQEKDRSAMQKTMNVCLVSTEPALIDDLAFVVQRVNAALAAGTSSPQRFTRSDLEAMNGSLGRAVSSDRALNVLMLQADRYLSASQEKTANPLRIEVLRYDSMDEARADLSRPTDEPSPGLYIVDMCTRQSRERSAPPSQHAGPDPCGELMAVCEEAGRTTRLSPHSAVVYLPPGTVLTDARSWAGNQHLRVWSPDSQARRADQLQILMDHLDQAHLSRMHARWGTTVHGPVGMAEWISGFMRANWSDRWDFHSYTGSMVAGFIRSMHELNADNGVRCLTGCNEHSLAVGALAGWQLFDRAYVIGVTSGMIDEFRGTLSNLQRARAPGLIVCADSPDSMWYAFQGTMDGESDGPQLMAARGITQLFICSPDEIETKLAEAFAHLARQPGPVIIFATQAALEARLPPPAMHDWPSAARTVDEPTGASQVEALNQALHIINQEPVHLLWQCGSLTGEEHALVLQIADKAGIALTDSLTHPGSVSEYNDGRLVPQYLGPMSMYGFNRRVYQFLHSDHRLNPVQDQCLFFLKRRIDQAATPFSQVKLKRQLRVVQVNHRAEHIAPFTDLALTMDSTHFLREVVRRLEVRPEVLAKRRAKLAALLEVSNFVASDHIATEPMSVNYFFRELGELIRELIEQDSYRYTGVYDVGRSGISAIRNIPRTDPGFSGWYGRALMGDANTALPYIVATTEHHVLGFVGDGARALVPDTEEELIAALAGRPDAVSKNVTVFYLCNGVLSLIQTYMDKRYAHNGREQMRVPAPACGNEQEDCGAIELRRKRISRFDSTFLREALSARGRINLIEVVLSHNSDGDGLSLGSETTWNRQ